jgi:enediyne biosynthesis protein E4
VWFDYNNDGLLDLFVCRFVDFSKELNKPCGIHDDGLRHYCIPTVYTPMPSWLFRNNGDGTFSDVSKESGIAGPLGKAWGVVAVDINNDGMIDLFVSNDTVRNFLFLNRGNGKFEEAGEIAGVAYSSDGRARSGMGVDAADYDQDGFMDLFVANLDRQSYSIYRNNHDETFDDTGAQTGIAAATYLMSGWGLKFFDFDNDGILDLLLVNGNPDDLIDRIHSQVTYEERPLLFQGSGKGLRNISQQSGPIFEQPLSGRGLAVGDFNNDGAMDVLIGVNDGAPVLLRNTAAGQNHWLGIKLVGNRSNRDAVGSRITYQAQDLKQSRMKVGGGSYLSSHDPRMVLGIGNRLRLDWVEIKWPLPGGKTERFTDLPIDRYITIIEGHAKWT